MVTSTIHSWVIYYILWPLSFLWNFFLELIITSHYICCLAFYVPLTNVIYPLLLFITNSVMFWQKCDILFKALSTTPGNLWILSSFHIWFLRPWHSLCVGSSSISSWDIPAVLYCSGSSVSWIDMSSIFWIYCPHFLGVILLQDFWMCMFENICILSFPIDW